MSPIGPAVPLPVRGASWMIIEYLQGHFGGAEFLTEATQTTVTGVANLVAASGLPWGTILHRWGIAIWADDAGVPDLDPMYTFTDVELREVFEAIGYPLLPLPLPWNDFQRTGELPSAGSQYWFLESGAGQGQLNIGLAGRHTPFTGIDKPQLSVLRIQ